MLFRSRELTAISTFPRIDPIVQTYTVALRVSVKIYRIEFAQDGGITCCYLMGIMLLCMSIVGIPLAVAALPTLYRIVEQ
jgi:hypothetical protein